MSITSHVCRGIAALLLSTSAALAAPPSGQDREVRTSPPQNYCLGGLEDRKLIVDEARLSNAFRETTLLGCEVDGGDPQTMPDLPRPSPDHQVLA